MTPGWMALFLAICALLLLLPFVPAWREWRHPTDVAALPISANYTSDIDHFARRLHADAQSRLGSGAPTGYNDFEEIGPEPGGMDWRELRRRLLSQHSLRTPGAIHARMPMYVQGDVLSGPDSSFSALYATGDIALGAAGEIHDWAHAGGRLRIGDNGVALRRASAGVSISLGNEVWFERLQAPAVFFGASAGLPPPAAGAEPPPASYADLAGAIERTPLHFIVRGNCALAPGRCYRGSLVVTGFLVIGAGTVVRGDVKARHGISLGRDARVDGAITCEKRIYVFERARAFGPLICEDDVLIGAGAVIGLPQAQTTVSARNIIVEDGAVVHGTLWAHEIGMVKSP